MAGEFHVNRAEFNRLFLSPTGPGGQELRRRLIRVQSRAKVLCPVRHGGLRSSITVSPIRRDGNTLVGSVGSHLAYAAAIHEGRASRYAPRSWSRRGPGPRRFLTNALPAAFR